MNPFEQLLTQNQGSNVAPEVLEMLGRQASQLFQSQNVPLNEAVAQVISNHPELGNEHVKRIVEFANTVTFQEQFQNSEDKNVHFEVADPGVVLRDIKDGGASAQSGKPLNSDYQKPPQQNQQGADLDAALMQQFTGSSTPISESVKVASASDVDHEKHANPLDDAYDTMVRLQDTRNRLVESYESMNLMMKQAQEDFYHQVKLQVIGNDGAGLNGVLSALQKIASEDLVEVVMVPVTERLVKEGHNKTTLMSSLTKTAGSVPNLHHPLFAAFDAIIKTAEEQVNCGQAISDVDRMLNDIKVPFKKLAGTLTTGVKSIVDPKGHVPAGIRQRFPRDL